MKLQYVVDHKNPRWKQVVELACAEIRRICETQDVLIKLGELVRTLDQNAAMWPALRDFARDVSWQVSGPDGQVRRADEEDWKSILTAAFERETEMTPGLNGGWVMLGARTSKFSKRKMGEFLSFIRAEGDGRGVRWSAQAEDNFAQYCRGER